MPAKTETPRTDETGLTSFPMRLLSSAEPHLGACAARNGSQFREQVGLHQGSRVGVERDAASFVHPLPVTPWPAAPDVDIGNTKAEHLGAAQPREQHEPGHSPVPVGPAAPEQGLDFFAVEPSRQPTRLVGS